LCDFPWFDFAELDGFFGFFDFGAAWGAAGWGADVVVDTTHGPTVSPWARCAWRAFWLTVIVTPGFFLECVR
jgi:hypothetical protein